MTNELKSEKQKFQCREDLTIHTLHARDVEILFADEAHQFPRCALSILDVFAVPMTIKEGHDLLKDRSHGLVDWMTLTETLSSMKSSGILLAENDPGAKSKRAPQGFGQPSIHIAMLRDEVRTHVYLDAVRATVREGDVVLDIGTGTGVLALAAAEAGARKVYAIEANVETARFARAVFDNSPHRDRIELIEGWSTEIELPEKCDLLVSEIIGYDLLDENILAVTSDAISRHLKPESKLIPSQLTIGAWPVHVPLAVQQKHLFCQSDITLWEQNYGLPFEPLLRMNPEQVSASLLPQKMASWDFVGEPQTLVSIDLALKSHLPIDEQSIFHLDGQQANGLVVYFELLLGEGHHISTQPDQVSPSNHWSSPFYLWGSEINDSLTVGYRYGRKNQSDGLYLVNEAKSAGI